MVWARLPLLLPKRDSRGYGGNFLLTEENRNTARTAKNLLELDVTEELDSLGFLFLWKAFYSYCDVGQGKGRSTNLYESCNK